MTYFTKEQISKAKEIDLYTYLKEYNPDELVRVSNDTYCTKTHDSLKISNGLWHWFSRRIGGKTALDYLIKVEGYTFLEAVAKLNNYANELVPLSNVKPKKENKEFVLPIKSDNNRIAKNYLINRGIDEAIIQQCIDMDFIYQDINNNVIFVGYDKNGVPRYAMGRGTGEVRFLNEVSGSHKAFTFKLDSVEKNNSVHLFECAIDLLSYATLLKNNKREWHKENLLSLAGVYKPKENGEFKIPLALNYYLNQHPNIKTIILHLDNDSIGRLATLGITRALEKNYTVIDRPPKVGKDFNDYLCITIKNKKKKEELSYEI